MKRGRFTEEQILGVLKLWGAGGKVDELSRANGVSTATLYEWRKKYAGLTISEAKRLRALEDENRKLKRIVADQALEIVAIKDVLSKNW
jgi:putative transposase